MKKILQTLLLTMIFAIFFTHGATAASCGETFALLPGEQPEDVCRCEVNNNYYDRVSTGLYCCGSYRNGQCYAYLDTSIYACGETLGGSSIPEGKLCNCAGAQWESYWKNKLLGIQGVCCGWTNEDKTQCLGIIPGSDKVFCGETFNPDQKSCICSNREYINENTSCCGWLRDGECKNTDVAINDVEVTAETLNNLNPINIGSGSTDLSTPGGIISKALKFFVFPIAGLILFMVLILGGFQMLAGANNSKSLEEGKQRITAAIIGFILLFAAYWIAQLLEIILGIRILS